MIAFNSRAQLLLDKTRDGNSVLDKLTFVQTRNNTALYDACYLGVEKVQRGAHPKRALLLISDGQDNNSRYTFKELRRLLKESDVTLYWRRHSQWRRCGQRDRYGRPGHFGRARKHLGRQSILPAQQRGDGRHLRADRT